MRAIQVIDSQPQLVEISEPAGNGVPVRVVSASICASDLHMMDRGMVEGRVLGHEFAGIAPDGRAVAVEPVLGCGLCDYCADGYPGHCVEQFTVVGVNQDGGMAETIVVPAGNLVELPSGLDIRVASLIEPLAVAAHGMDQARIAPRERVLVIGAGAIGLSVAAVLQYRGLAFDIAARHPAQQSAALRLGGRLSVSDGYDVVIDAVGSQASIDDAVNRVRARGRICMVGSFWEPTPVPQMLCVKEIALVGSMLYRCGHPDQPGGRKRTFDEAGKLLAGNPHVADILISHRFPLDGVSQAFAAARDRSSGAIKVCFDVRD